MTLADLGQRIENEYRSRTPKSKALFREADAYLPGGDTRTGTSFRPYPTYFTHGEGSYLHDVDGNEVLDFTNNATSLIHGHAHPEIVKVLEHQLACGTGWSAPNSHQVHLAQILCQRVPSLERVRFCNSGTEANMQAIKAARAFTGRDRILMMDGAYHGSYEDTEFEGADSALPHPRLLGIPVNAAENVLVAPYDDAAAAERLVERHQSDLAAVIVNPVFTQGRLGLPSEGYLGSLRELTRSRDVLLIFDEVITFRMAPGGAQDHFGVTPDLTALGKIIGGGLPVGAFGGRADIMALFADKQPPSITHAGTFNGNPLTLAAGIASLELLTEEAYERLARLGSRLQQQIQEISTDLGLPFEVNRMVSLVSPDLPQATSPDPAHRAMAEELRRLLNLALLNRGIKADSNLAISTVMTEVELERLTDTLRDVLAEFAPAMESFKSVPVSTS